MSGAGQDTRASSPACGGRRARGLSGAAKALFNSALAVIVICVLICQPFTLSLNSWHIEEQKAHAIPAAIPVALEVLNGIATAIGITEIGLSIYNGVSMSGSTGYQPYDVEKTPVTTEMKALPAPKGTETWPAWDNLSSDNKTAWGTEENYRAGYQCAMLRETVFTSDEDVDYFRQMTEHYENGGTGDVPQPSESTKGKMTKIKNTAGQLLAGGAVALPAIMQLSDDVSHIFTSEEADSNVSFNVPYIANTTINGVPVLWTASSPAYNELSSTTWASLTVTSPARWWYPKFTPPIVNLSISGAGNVQLKTDASGTWGQATLKSTGIDGTGSGSLSEVIRWNNVNYNYLNINYVGGYKYGEVTSIPGTLPDAWSPNVDYDQMEETPDDLQKSIIDPVAYNTYIENLGNGLPEGQTLGLSLPQGGITPETNYNDLVQSMPETQVKEDLDYPSDDPQNPNEEPMDPEEKDLKTRVMNALNAPFAAIFPFCLLDDAKRMFFIFANHGATGEYDYLRFDISGYGVSSEQYFVIDLHGLKDLGNTVRWIFNLMLAALLLRAAYRFFVEQSGGD